MPSSPDCCFEETTKGEPYNTSTEQKGKAKCGRHTDTQKEKIAAMLTDTQFKGNGGRNIPHEDLRHEWFTAENIM
jgi:hypothetical protein